MLNETKPPEVGVRMGHRVTIKRLSGHDRYNWRATFVEGGKRKQKYFTSETKAKAWAKDREAEALAHGTNGTLSDLERSAVLEMRSELAKVGLSVREALTLAVEQMRKEKRSCTVSALVAAGIFSRERAGRSDKHLTDMRSKWGRFEKTFGERVVVTIACEEVEDWLHGLNLSPASFNSYRRVLVVLFNDGVKGGYLTDNPAAKVETSSVKEAKFSALDPHEAAALLCAADAAILPAFAIGLFAGVRDAELKRLSWASVNLNGDEESPHGHIWLEGKDTKKAKNRIIPVSENLKAWLVSRAKENGSIWPENGRKLAEATHFAAGFGTPSEVAEAKEKGECLKAWPQNALRHSYASFYLAHHRDAAALALNLGHTNTAIIFSNYRKLVTASDAAKYWSIKPENAAEVAKQCIA